LFIRGVERKALTHVKATRNQTAAAPTITKARTAEVMRSQRVCIGCGEGNSGHN
jgi:cytochrome c551/c552